MYAPVSCAAATILMEGGTAHDLSILEDMEEEGRAEGVPRKDPTTGEKHGVCVCAHVCGCVCLDGFRGVLVYCGVSIGTHVHGDTVIFSGSLKIDH